MSMNDARRKFRSLTTKVNAEEFAIIMTLSGGAPITSEWLRNFLLQAARGDVRTIATMAELQALRAIIQNVLMWMTDKGTPMTDKDLRKLVDFADANKHDQAVKALADAVERR
jgi:hypothetical protein